VGAADRKLAWFDMDLSTNFFFLQEKFSSCSSLKFSVY
jgi:hypothetical protein